MKSIYLLVIVALAPCISALTNAKVVCFYDSRAHNREDSGKFLVADMKNALEHCTHLLYGSARIDPVDFKVKSIDPDFDEDTGKMNYKAVTALKKLNPHLQVLLSIGNWADIDEEKNTKYLDVLTNPDNRNKFISSARSVVSRYNFDGVDLAWQFPLQRVQDRGTFGGAWHKLKKTFGLAKGSKDENAEEHRHGFTALIKQLKQALRADNFQLTYSVIPHTNYTNYIDLRECTPHLDAIHLQAFDYLTAEDKISPDMADHSSPLSPTYNRNPAFNIEASVKWFLDNGCPNTKLILGIPTYGRTWKLTSDSSASGAPPLAASGPGAEGHLTHVRGLLSFPEVCTMSQNPNNHGTKGLLRKVTDPSKKLGTYAFRPEDSEREGIWVSYEDKDTVRQKADYARKLNLGGVAIYDLSLDDFRGLCAGEHYPLLKAAKSAFP